MIGLLSSSRGAHLGPQVQTDGELGVDGMEFESSGGVVDDSEVDG